MIKLTINGKTIEVAEGTTVLDAAKMLNIEIPTLCHHPKLTPFGGCRLCIVEVKGVPRPLTSCTTPVSEGMEVTTSTPALEGLRKTVLELILSDHPNDCMVCEKAGDCTLQELAYFYGIRENRFGGERRIYGKKDGNPFIERDMEKCILCGRCVKVCDEVQGVGAIDFAYRGFKSKICPTFEKDTTCSYCGTGCNLTLHVRQNEVVRVTSKEDTWNEGWLCVKGRFGYSFINSPDRLKKPLIKRNGKFEEASWNEALDYISAKLREIKEKHGPDSIAGLSSARCTNEENYLFQKFMRTGIGTNNVDHCARL